MFDRNKQPQGCHISVFSPNQSSDFRQYNGVGMYAIDVDDTELLRVDIMFKGGQWMQVKPLQAAMTYKLMREETNLYPHKSVSEKLDYYGAVINTGVNMSYGHISLTCLKRHIRNVLPIVLSMICQPRFSEQRLDLALSQAKAAYDINMQMVSEQSRRLYYKSLFKKGHPMTQFPEVFDYFNLTTEDLHDYAETNFRKSECTVFFTGKVDESVVQYVADQINTIDGEGKSLFKGFGAFERTALKKRRFVYNMQSPTLQASLRIGCPIIQRKNPDYACLKVLTTMLGGYFGSRLMSNIRKNKGLTYDIGASLFQTPQMVLLSIKTETPISSVEHVVSEIHNEIQRLCVEPATEPELVQVKNYILGSMCRSYESNFSLSSRLMNMCAQELTLNDIASEVQVIQSVTQEDILLAAQHYYQSSEMVECIAM